MNIIRTASLGLLVPALLALSPVEDELSFHPVEGLSLTKTFSFEFDFALDDVQMLVDGQDMGGMIAGQIPEVQMANTMTVVDTYNTMGEGRPLQLTRLFEELLWEYDAGEESGSESVDDLEGQEVRFAWDEDQGIYVVSVVDEEAEVDEEILNSLGEDMDLRGILPDGPVSEGDTWELSGERVWTVLMPGMDLAKSMDSADVPAEAQPVMDFFRDQIDRFAEGFRFQCEYMGSREEGDTMVGVIAITVESTLEIDMVPMIEDMLAQNEMPIEPNIDYADIELELSGSGELLWNLRAGHVQHFELESDVAFFIDASASFDAGQGEQTSEASFEFSGTMTWGADVE